jgi:hypothetical protein
MKRPNRIIGAVELFSTCAGEHEVHSAEISQCFPTFAKANVVLVGSA